MLFETRCAGCDKPGAAICSTCRFSLIGRTPRKRTYGVIAAVRFTGRARRIMLSLKYRNRRQAARHMAGLLVNRLVESGEYATCDVVTWAPTSAHRRRERGFDQGEVIARTVARQLGIPFRRLLERQGRSEAQTGSSRASRLTNPSFRARGGLAGATVLVVDDVVTTGSTLQAARRALEAAGAGFVVLAAVAATPAPAQAPCRAASGPGHVGVRQGDGALLVPFRRPQPTTAA